MYVYMYASNIKMIEHHKRDILWIYKASSSSKVYPSQTNTARGYDDARIMKVQICVVVQIYYEDTKL